MEFKTPEEVFSGKKLEVNHLNIFGCPVFIHIPEDKRTKLDPFGKRGLFFGYCEVSKAFRIYIPGLHHIEISRDVTFDEETALKRSRKCRYEEVYEEEAPKAFEPVVGDTLDDLDGHDELEPQEPLCMTISHKRKPTREHEVIQEVERFGAPEGSSRERKKSKPFSSYVALMCNLVDQEPSCYEEDVKKKEWVEAMTKEYHSIMKNDVWSIVPRPKARGLYLVNL